MFSEVVSAKDALFILDLKEDQELDEAVRRGEMGTVRSGSQGAGYVVKDLVLLKLAWTIQGIGVEPTKATRYAEAVLGSRLSAHHERPVEWIENETQELYCLIADSQLARIFLRNKDDFREVDIGAVKPVLLPSIKSEINVFRVIRPVIYRARQVLGRKGTASHKAP